MNPEDLSTLELKEARDILAVGGKPSFDLLCDAFKWLCIKAIDRTLKERSKAGA